MMRALVPTTVIHARIGKPHMKHLLLVVPLSFVELC